MAIQHRDIVDPEQHEPKGASTASANTVYRADGAGSGDWEAIDRQSLNEADVQAWIEESIDAGDILIQERFMLQASIPDLATGGSTYVVVPENWSFVRADAVITDDAADGDDGDPATVEFFDAGDTSLGTAVSVAVTAVAGDMAVFTPTAPEADLTGPTYIRITWTPVDLTAANTVVPAYITLSFENPIA